MIRRLLLSFVIMHLSLAGLASAADPPKTVGNPVIPGWYADPEARVFGNQYWIFATYSAPYDQQTLMDAFSSKDLITWQKHSRARRRSVAR